MRARRRVAGLTVALMVTIALAGCGGGSAASQDRRAAGPEPAASPSASATTGSADDAEPAATAAPDEARAPIQPRSAARPDDPVVVRVAALDIEAAIDPLHLGANDELVPPEYGRAGWYADGPEPGELGRSVIAGHLDSRTGPDVFADLAQAKPGQRIDVELGDGSTEEFTVTDVGLFHQDRFPTDRVYGGPEQEAELRLITCGGDYDPAAGRYESNVVVFAEKI